MEIQYNVTGWRDRGTYLQFDEIPYNVPPPSAGAIVPSDYFIINLSPLNRGVRLARDYVNVLNSIYVAGTQARIIPIRWVAYFVYVAFVSTQYHSNAYIGEVEEQIVTSIDDFIFQPDISINNATTYRYTLFSLNIYEARIEESFNINSYKIIPVKPYYRDLVDGYYLDSRQIPNQITIDSPETKEINLKYYCKGGNQPIQAIEWMTYKIKLTANVPCLLPINNPVLGTLHCDEDVKNLIISQNTPNETYDFKYLFEENLPELFNYWNSLYLIKVNEPLLPPTQEYPVIDFQSSITNYTEIQRKIRILGANNNVWNNRENGTEDLNIDDPSHPMIEVNELKAYNRWIEVQNDDSRGRLILDSPRLIEIHAALEAGNNMTTNVNTVPPLHTLAWWIKNGNDKKKVTEIHQALNAGKYGVDPDNNELPREWDLGTMIEAIARVLGLRRSANGKIDREREELVFKRKILTNPSYNKDAYFTNGWGNYGHISPNLTNIFGDNAHDVSYDFLQYIDSKFEHLNRSLGIQQGTNIELKNSVNGKLDKFPNQLSMMLDLESKLTETNQNSREILNLVTVASQEQRELVSGIGFAASQKRLHTRYGEFTYIGHQSDKGSINTSLTTLKTNLGIALGDRLARPIDRKNPLERFVFGLKSSKSNESEDEQQHQTKKEG